MGVKPRLKKMAGAVKAEVVPGKGGTGMFADVLAENVRDVIELYGTLWERRYSGKPVVTGNERSKLADLLSQVQDVCAVKRAVRHYFEDDGPRKAGHSVAWFVGTYNEHAAASAGGGKKGGNQKARACKGREEFEDEVERYKAGCDVEEGEQPGKAGTRSKVRRRKRG